MGNAASRVDMAYPAASPNNRIMFDFVRRGRRSARVARTGATIYLGYKRTQRKVRKLDAPAAEAAWEHAHTVNAERLYRMAVDLKGLYIKGGQFLGTRSDVVPAPYTKSLSRLQDSVPPRPIAQVRALIEAEFERPIAELFATFDDTPLGAASLAQVHRATLADGRQVVAKVQYPEVARSSVSTSATCARSWGIVARREPNFDYRAIVNEIGQQVPLELDFVREADMTRRIGANLSGLPGDGAARGRSLVTRRVLVTEGHRRRAAAGMRSGFRAWPSTGASWRARLRRAYGHHILVDGLFQADPHPATSSCSKAGAWRCWTSG